MSLQASSGLERWQIQWDALLTIIRGEAVAGGRLAGIVNIEGVAPPEKGIFPCIGVQFSNFVETTDGPRRHSLVSMFDIVVAVQQPFSPIVSDTTQLALQQLRTYVNDGNGNGLSPILRGNPILSVLGGPGNCSRGQISSMVYNVAKSDTQTASVIASALYTYQAEDRVNF